MKQISLEQIHLFRSFFKARTDVYARFWANPAANKSGYAPVYRLNYHQDALNDQVILSHLSGKELFHIKSSLMGSDFSKGNQTIDLTLNRKTNGSFSVVNNGDSSIKYLLTTSRTPTKR